jgi:hypothetical protein
MLVLAITRSVIYAHKKSQQDAVDEELLLQLPDEEYTRHRLEIRFCKHSLHFKISDNFYTTI